MINFWFESETLDKEKFLFLDYVLRHLFYRFLPPLTFILFTFVNNKSSEGKLMKNEIWKVQKRPWRDVILRGRNFVCLSFAHAEEKPVEIRSICVRSTPSIGPVEQHEIFINLLSANSNTSQNYFHFVSLKKCNAKLKRISIC